MTGETILLFLLGAVNTIALAIIGWLLSSFRRTIDKLAAADDKLNDRVGRLEIDNAATQTWRKAQEQRHTETLASLAKIEKSIEGLVDKIERKLEDHTKSFMAVCNIRHPQDGHGKSSPL